MEKIVLIENQHKMNAVKSVISRLINEANNKLDNFEKTYKITLSGVQVENLMNGRIDEVPILKKVWPHLPDRERAPYLREVSVALSTLKGLVDSQYQNSYMQLVYPRLCVEVKDRRLVPATDLDDYLQSVFEVAILTEKMQKVYQKAQKVAELVAEIKDETGLRFDQFMDYHAYFDTLEPNPYEFNEVQPIK